VPRPIRLVIALLAVALAVAAAPALASSWVIRDAPLKARPDPESRTRAHLCTCDRVDVLERRHGWLRVESDLGHGWIAARHVSRHRPAHCHRTRVDIILQPPILLHPWPGHPDPWPWHRPVRPRPPQPLDQWNQWHDW
jgi:hypothetical protein